MRRTKLRGGSGPQFQLRARNIRDGGRHLGRGGWIRPSGSTAARESRAARTARQTRHKALFARSVDGKERVVVVVSDASQAPRDRWGRGVQGGEVAEEEEQREQ